MSDDYWANLIRAVELLSKHQTGPFPFHCEHDELFVMSDPSAYAPEELAELEELGFHAGEEHFTSFLYGSA